MATQSQLARRLAVARGDEPADVVVRGGRVLSVFTREWLDVDVAIADGWIAGLGEYDGDEVVDAAGGYVVPGFIDAHVHLESSKLLPDEFARLVLPLGTTAVVADPHEIANVLGTDGVHWLLDASADSPLDVYFTAAGYDSNDRVIATYKESAITLSVEIDTSSPTRLTCGMIRSSRITSSTARPA